MHLRHTLVLAVAQRANERDDIQSELAVRQRVAAFRLGAIGSMVAVTSRVATPADGEGQADEAVERLDGAVVVVGHPHRRTAAPTLIVTGVEGAASGRFRPSGCAGHRMPPHACWHRPACLTPLVSS